ncbi:Peptidase_S10 domain-containing protein [Cephalotus follicularis]|uniref:Peptidase_S10 domain-containing protein n=1 Tax=Cephalotus follicularis TaxID=3775 RepID=A0A1Q3DDT0_CEPFO|nr:Peptidase_S10 domain-containing protein [Cephalotus follicularis]
MKIWSHVILSLNLLTMVVTQSIIKTLPGFQGDLPFTFETGYIGAGDLDDVQLFYYFIESERSPKDDPLMLWLTGGPGCSAFSGLVYEIGPLQFDYAKSSGNKPVFTLNPYSWTKVANIIFLDSPVGTGFSYSNTWQGYNVSDTITAEQVYEFLRKWLMDHPKFLTNPLYIAGDSYSGKIVPIVVQEISDGNEVGHQPPLNLKGYVLGNPVTDEAKDLNSRVLYAQLKALISDELYESTKLNCMGEYIHPDPSNALCIKDLQNVTDCIGRLYTANILEPNCAVISPKPMGLKWDRGALVNDYVDVLLSTPNLPGPWCRSYNYLYSYIWANDKTVQEALYIREGTKEEWDRCNKSLSYLYNVLNALPYHRNLIKKGYRVLIYSGDQDLAIPYVGTQAWIKSLNLTIDSDWAPWFVDGQVAGYTVEYKYNKYSLTFATVKGGGHTAPEYKPKECFAMLERWLAYYAL